MMSFAYERGLPEALRRGLVDDARHRRRRRARARPQAPPRALRRPLPPLLRPRPGDPGPPRRAPRRRAPGRDPVGRAAAEPRRPARCPPARPDRADRPAGRRRAARCSAPGPAPGAATRPSACSPASAPPCPAPIEHVAGVPIEGGDAAGIAAAAAAAARADRVVLCLGEAAWMSGEAASRARIDLPGRQAELAAAVLATGTPTVVLLFSGRPIAMPEVFARAAAVLACWFPGSEAGHAIADLLTGAAAPSAQPRRHLAAPRRPGPHRLFSALRAGVPRTRRTSTPASTSTCPTARSSPSATA